MSAVLASRASRLYEEMTMSDALYEDLPMVCERYPHAAVAAPAALTSIEQASTVPLSA
jgi:hypothetical protein